METTANPPRIEETSYRADIDGLRAIAVLSVVGFHAFPNWIKGGFIGVDIFFVISGYLISRIILGGLCKDTFSFAAFYSRRVKRIFPSLAVILAASYIFGWVLLLPDEYMKLGRNIAYGASFLSNFALWNDAGYFDRSAVLNPLLHLWSLGIEEQFYLAWPLLLFLMWKVRLKPFSLIVVSGAISFIVNVDNVHADAVGTFYSPLTRFWELLIGGTLANKPMLNIDSGDGVVRNIKSIVGFILIMVATFALGKDQAFPGWWALMPTIGAYSIIAAGPTAVLNRLILSRPLLVGVGLISYPLYLWHWPLLSFVHNVESGTPSNEITSVVVLVSILLAWITYRFIERPIRLARPDKARVLSLCILMAVLGLIGFGTYRYDGLAFRIPVAVKDILSYRYNYEKEYRVGVCLLLPEQDKSAFGDCTNQPAAGYSRSVILWGDSHAAHLYPGLKRQIGGKYRLTQLTSAGCPPILDVAPPSSPHCKDTNIFIFNKIVKELPDRIVMAAVWDQYDWNNFARMRLYRTIQQLKQLGVRRIDLVGPVPRWENGLPQSLYRFYKQDVMFHRMPERMLLGLTPGTQQLDDAMREFAAELDVNYISAMDALCNNMGCLTMVPGGDSQLTAWDYGHLTTAGSELVARHISE